MDMRVGLQSKLSVKKIDGFELWGYIGQYTWASLELQGDQTSQP